MRTARLTLVAAFAAVALLFCPARARAQTPATPDPAAIEEAKKHFAEGTKKYNAGDKAGAVEEFKEAYKLTRNALLLYNIGFVYDELHDKPLAVHYYGKFLSDAPDNEKTAPNRKLAADRLPILKKEIADEEAAAQRAAEEAAKAAEEAARREKAAKDTRDAGEKGVTEFVHEVVEEAPPKLPLDVVALIPEESGWNLTLYYRAAGEDQFQAVKMKQRYQEMVGRIPPTAMLGNAVQYYIEVKDKRGELVASSGRAASPNIVYIDEAAKRHFYTDLSEEGSSSFAEDGETTPIPIDPGKKKKERTPLWWGKWGATAATAGFLTATVIFHQTAANNSAALEAEARNAQGGCGNPPCRTFSGTQKGYQTDGEFAETMTNVMLFATVGVAATAGVLWYLDFKAEKRRQKLMMDRIKQQERESEESMRDGRFMAAPVITDDFIGGAAVIYF